MAGTTFVDKSTVIQAAWLQSINDFFYNLFQGATTVTAAKAALGLSDPTVVTVTGTSRTLQSSDAGAYIVCTSNSAVTITIPSATFTAPTNFIILQQGNGQVTVVGDGVTLRCAGTPSTRTQYSALGVVQTVTGTFYVTGDFVA